MSDEHDEHDEHVHVQHEIPDDPHVTHLIDQGRAAARERFDLMRKVYDKAKEDHADNPEHAIFCAATNLERIMEKVAENCGFIRGDTIIFNILASAMYAIEKLDKLEMVDQNND